MEMGRLGDVIDDAGDFQVARLMSACVQDLGQRVFGAEGFFGQWSGVISQMELISLKAVAALPSTNGKRKDARKSCCPRGKAVPR